MTNLNTVMVVRRNISEEITILRPEGAPELPSEALAQIAAPIETVATPAQADQPVTVGD